MKYLSLSDRKDAALVCRTWYEAFLDPILQRDIILHFYASTAARTGKDISSLYKRRLPHLILNDFDSSLEAKAVVLKSCEHFGENLKSLSLKGSNLTERTFVELMSNCKNLVSLDLSCCNSLFMSGTLLELNSDLQVLKNVLGNVQEVNLSSIRHISDVTFNRIMTVCENVEKLALCSAPIVFSNTLFQQSRHTRFANSSVLTFSNIMDFVITQQCLKSLNLSRTLIDDDHLETIVSIKELHLEELILVGCRNVSDEGIASVCKHQHGLALLDIRECPDLTNGALMAISASLRNLRHLFAQKCKLLSDASMACLHKLTSLQTLDISECHQVTSEGLIAGLCTKPLTQLTCLNVSCTEASDSFVEMACESLPLLTQLDLSSCFKVTDVGLHAIAKHLKYLRYLRLAFCNEITDLGLLGLQPQPGHIIMGDTENMVTRKYPSTVIFKAPNKIDRSGIVTNGTPGCISTSTPVAISNLAGLRSLDLTACKKLTDVGLMQTIKFAELRFLGLGILNDLSDEGLICLVYQNPSLEELDVIQCNNITDDSIEVVTRHLKRLRVLNVKACSQLTDRSVGHIKRNCKNLRHLDVSFCGGISHEAMDDLELTLTSLLSVQKRMIGS
ncbi:hypothetical protein DPMN_126387 [Dreissena polymorpha]|uniref:F-box/LRR-repeat protein 15-like leucin rich repeat domain-containing protein n=2 Tax=Dreissena polymorpha TaxID=45954 RepID=A0A9D4GZF3_DREPO|nr:hypothetical protein DPMN_126387 [Dreissena polymorpha]